MVYCATARVGAFGETIAGMRPSLDVLAGLADVDDDEPVDLVLEGLSDPDRPQQGVVSSDWRRQRRIGRTFVNPNLLFVDIAAAETLQYLRHSLASIAVVLGVDDIDLSAVAGPYRRFTQECARHIYQQQNADRQPMFAGIRYISRFNLNWECWAVFDNRFQHTPFPAESIHPTDPGLLEAASLFGLSIEGVRAGQYIQP